MKANAEKFQGLILTGSRNNTDVQVSLGDVDIAFVHKMDVLGVCIDVKLNFNEHVRRIWSKASAQISALQRLTGLVDYPSRKAIYTSFIASNFNYCPLVWLFTSRDSINNIDKIQKRALRLVLKDYESCYKDLLLKSGFDSFRIYAVKSLMIELYNILEGMTPNYLSELFVKADTPYNTRDKCRLIQPMKRTTTYGRFSITGHMPGICFLYTWKQHSHCLNLNLSLNHGPGRHVHVLYVLPCCKKYPPTYWLLVTGSVISPYILITGDGICRRYGLMVICEVVEATTFFFFGFQHSRMSQRRRFCHFGGVLRWFHWMMSLDNLQCVRWLESRRDDDIFVSVNNHWVFYEIAYILIP